MTDRRTFAALDGVRGIAALAVMAFHTGSWPVVGRLFPSAYLAVDLFFALSGFVVALAYGERMAQGMGARAFLRARFVRLWPLFALGMAVGLSAFVIRGLRFGDLDVWETVKSFSFQASFLPDLSTAASDGRMFPMNGPAWSLFFELGVNVVFAFTALSLNRRTLIWLAPALAAGLVITAFSFHGLDAGHRWDNAWGGVTRVGFSFTAGLLLHALWREGRLPTLDRWAAPAGWIAVGALLFLMMADPARAWRPLFDVAVVALAWPALMVALIAARPDGAVRSACGVLGKLSYPAYVLHGPLFALCLNFAAMAGVGLHPIPAAFWPCAIVATLALSWLSVRLYDEPVRRWLTARLAARSAEPAVAAQA